VAVDLISPGTEREEARDVSAVSTYFRHQVPCRAPLQTAAPIVGALLALSALLTGCSTPRSTAASPHSSAAANPYFTGRFTATVNRFTFGQDPSWTADGRVLSNENERSGTSQIYVSHLDGSGMSCLTCGQPGPNGFPQERPQGDWILFCAFRGQTVTFGAPCLGGFGSDLYLMRPDGSHVTRVTGPSSSFERGGDPYDNYHPSWSPDGRHLVWTHVDYRTHARGGTQWSILLSTLMVDKRGVPSLSIPTEVAPGGDNAYETQVWAPDGSGVLYTSLSSDGDKRLGWLNSELHFMRLFGHGASPSHPEVTHLTDGNPGWDEQAVFTPDMKDVVWMSSRGTRTWYETTVAAARRAGYDPPFENEVAGPFFVLTILDPKFRTDLYELDLTTHAVRRLTDLDQVVPEFYFDPGGSQLMWTTGDRSRTFVGRFARSSESPIRANIRVDPAWVDAPVHGDHSPPAPEEPTSVNLKDVTLPPQEVAATSLLESQLTTLDELARHPPRHGS